ncbi:MAG: alpha/beta fold hydrolase [Planctomycetota bacterium]|nr:MAG: alpha/beta fold hydrolase [Planctomycetota bacterium]
MRKHEGTIRLPAASRFFDLGGVRMHYLDAGSGTPVLFVHGNPTWVYYWRRPFAEVAEFRRAVAIDQIGCGWSDRPSLQAYSYRLRQRIDDLKAFVEGLDLQNIALVAHDWGGAVGLGAATELPDRFSAIVLSNTAAFPGGRCPLRIRVGKIPLLGRWAIVGANLFVTAALRMAVSRRDALSREVKANLAAPYASAGRREAIYRFVEDIPLRPNHPSFGVLSTIERELEKLRHLPVCLIWGMRDWCFTPWFRDRFLEIFPHAESHELDVGHYLVEEVPEAYTQILVQFLRRCSE